VRIGLALNFSNANIQSKANSSIFKKLKKKEFYNQPRSPSGIKASDKNSKHIESRGIVAPRDLIEEGFRSYASFS
jgi:hypothetical protein